MKVQDTWHEVNHDVHAILKAINALLPQVAGSNAEEETWLDKRDAQEALRIVFLAQPKLLPKAAAIRDRLSKYL